MKVDVDPEMTPRQVVSLSYAFRAGHGIHDFDTDSTLISSDTGSQTMGDYRNPTSGDLARFSSFAGSRNRKTNTTAG